MAKSHSTTSGMAAEPGLDMQEVMNDSKQEMKDMNEQAGSGASRRGWLARAAISAVSATAAGLLVACATNEVSKNTELGAKDGVVALRVVKMDWRVLDQFIVQNLETQQVYRLSPQPTLGGDSLRFMGVLPAGRYQARSLHGQTPQELATVNVVHTLDVPLAGEQNQFEVQPAVLTNLGSLVFLPLADKRFIAPRESTPVAAREWLHYANPALEGKLQPVQEKGWLQPPAPRDAELLKQQLVYAESRALPIGPPLPDAKGAYWNVGKLGTVFELSNGLRYRAGTVQQLTALARLADDSLLVGGEEGYVAVSTPDRRSWRLQPSPASKAAVALLATQAPDGTVYLVSRTPNGVVVHAADTNAVTWNWREVRRLPHGSEGRPPLAVNAGERIVVYTAGPDTLSSLDLRTGQWEAHPVQGRVQTLRGWPDGLVLAVGFSRSFEVTADFGRTWQQLDQFGNSTLPEFVSPTRGYVAAVPFGSARTAPTLFKTTDSGKTWTNVGSAPPGVNSVQGTLVYDRVAQRLGYEVASGKIAWSSDEGKSWQ